MEFAIALQRKREYGIGLGSGYGIFLIELCKMAVIGADMARMASRGPQDDIHSDQIRAQLRIWHFLTQILRLR